MALRVKSRNFHTVDVKKHFSLNDLDCSSRRFANTSRGSTYFSCLDFAKSRCQEIVMLFSASGLIHVSQCGNYGNLLFINKNFVKWTVLLINDMNCKFRMIWRIFLKHERIFFYLQKYFVKSIYVIIHVFLLISRNFC